jgi:hypothetical protein
MKLAMVMSVVGAIVLASAAARAGDEAAAAKAAKAWLDPVLAGGEVAPAPSKDKPLDWAANIDAKACVKLGKAGNGRVADGAGGKKLAACVVAAWKQITKDPPANPTSDWKTGSLWRKVDTLDDVAENFPTAAQQKRIKAAGKDVTVVASGFTGEMIALTIYAAVGPDGAVRAVYLLVSSND